MLNRRAAVSVKIETATWIPTVLSTVQVKGSRSGLKYNILRQNQTGLPNHNPKPTPAWLGGAMRRSHAIAKKHAFLYVFSRPAQIVV